MIHTTNTERARVLDAYAREDGFKDFHDFALFVMRIFPCGNCRELFHSEDLIFGNWEEEPICKACLEDLRTSDLLEG